jgi:hypothetical protein
LGGGSQSVGNGFDDTFEVLIDLGHPRVVAIDFDE